LLLDLPSRVVCTECQAACDLSYEACRGVRDVFAISYKGLVSLTCRSFISILYM